MHHASRVTDASNIIAGDADSQYLLGNSYSAGINVPLDHVKSTYWYLRAAVQGHARGQSSYAHALALGIGVETDDAEALRWAEEAARNGCAAAQGLMAEYCESRGMDTALYWTALAAEQGHPKAIAALLRTLNGGGGGARVMKLP